MITRKKDPSHYEVLLRLDRLPIWADNALQRVWRLDLPLYWQEIDSNDLWVVTDCSLKLNEARSPARVVNTWRMASGYFSDWYLNPVSKPRECTTTKLLRKMTAEEELRDRLQPKTYHSD